MSDFRQTVAHPPAMMTRMHEDDLRYRAAQSRDARFDGWFFVGVTSTGIYCRPSCASVVPRRDRVRFFPTAAAAQRAGFRACKRCRPDAAPGSPEWNRRGDVVGRAMRYIEDGVVDREGVTGLAARLGYSTRQLNRLLLAEVGAGPLELARAQRAQLARILLETTSLRTAEVAFAAGFGSVRQFNETMLAVFAEPPTALRARARRRPGAAVGMPPGSGGSVTLRLAYRPPLASAELWGFLAARAVPGVESGDACNYRRTLALPHGAAVAEVRAPFDGETWCRATLWLEDLRDLNSAVKRFRQLFDLDSDPSAVAEVLGRDPFLAPALAARPGLRVPGHVDGDELAVRAVLGQQVSVAGARTLAARLALRCGRPLPDPIASRLPEAFGLERTFPTAEEIASLSAAHLPMPESRARALIGLAEALAVGKVSLDPGADRDEASARLLELPGIGPWTVSYVRMRALGDPDAYLPSDLGVRRALERAGLPGDERSASAMGERWRPYRAYALQYLWSKTMKDKEKLA
jgi:AraC family transcriptional regulator of adaptative response / DNA-3-methyladenine glycosylase II